METRFTDDETVLGNKTVCASTLHSLHKMQKMNEYCDVTLELQLEDSDEEAKIVIKAHACVLAAGSATFSGSFDKSSRNQHVLLNSVDENILQACVKYMYGQEITLKTKELSNLKQAAKVLQIPSLLSHCDIASSKLELLNSQISTDFMLHSKFEQNETMDSSVDDKALFDRLEVEDESLEVPNSIVNVTHGLTLPTKDFTTDQSVDERRENELFRQPKENISDISPGSIDQVTLISNPTLGKDKKRASSITLNIKGKKVSIDDLPPAIRNALIPKKCSKVLTSSKLGKTTTIVNVAQSGQKGEHSLLDDSSSANTVVRNERDVESHTAKYSDSEEESADTALSNTHSTKTDEGDADSDHKEVVRTYGWEYRYRQQKLKCDHCDQTFSGLIGLREHKARVQKNPDLKHRKASLIESKDKRREVRLKNEQTVYNCDECGEIIKGWKKLYVHKLKVHKLSHVCSYCGKAFPYPNALKTHEQRHLQVKNYICAHCDYRAVTKKEIEYHEQLKHLNLSFSCDQCNAAFKSHLYLRRHIQNVHMKEPQKCVYCDYRVVSKSAMKRHVLNKHFPDRRVMWPCDVCGKSFTNKGHLDRHLRDVHRTNPTPKLINSIKLKTENDSEDVKINVRPIPTPQTLDPDLPPVTDIAVDVSDLKQGIAVDYLSNDLYFREEDGVIGQTLDANPPQGMDVDTHLLQGATLTPEVQIAHGIPVQQQEEIVYYEDDIYIYKCDS